MSDTATPEVPFQESTPSFPKTPARKVNYEWTEKRKHAFYNNCLPALQKSREARKHAKAQEKKNAKP